MTTTLVATPDPAPFDIHAQPTWIALGIGKVWREYPDMQVVAVERVLGVEPDYVGKAAYVDFVSGASRFTACIAKWDMSPIYIDEVTS